jgi:hypothetical protein
MHRIGYLLSDSFQGMALATQAAFEYPNFVAKDDFYVVAKYSESGDDVRSSFGASIGTLALGPRSLAQAWIVAGSRAVLGNVRRSSSTLTLASTHSRAAIAALPSSSPAKEA